MNVPDNNTKNEPKTDGPNNLSTEDWEVIKAGLDLPPSQLTLRIYNFQKMHNQAIMNSNMESYVKLFEGNHTFLAKFINDLNLPNKATWKDHNTLQSFLLSTIPKTLFSSFQQMMWGDYDESMATSRIAYECLLRVCFIQMHPKDMWAGLVKPPQGQIEFQASNFMTQDAKVIKEDYIYKILSDPIHGMRLRIMLELKHSTEKGKVQFNLGYQYDKKMLNMTFTFVIVILYFAIRIFSQFLKPLLEPIRQEPNLTTFTALDRFIRTLPKNKLSEFPNIIDKLFAQIS